MKALAIAVGTLVVAAATAASAQTYNSPGYEAAAPRSECWNTNGGHFEAVRPGETQNDLDFSRCRVIGGRHYARRFTREECWNPGAKHYENVRPGERQDDLDYSRCRVVRDEPVAYDPNRR